MNDLGREKILLPLEPYQLDAETIQTYLPTVLDIHFRNCIDYTQWLDYFKGRQPILEKKRYNDSEINNMIVVNHAAEAVNFLKGHTFGDPVKYSKKETDQTDDIDVLNTYMLEQNKATLNTNLSETFYIAGVGYMWCYGRNADVDLTKQAPFELRLLDNQNAFVAYSTNIQGDKLFGGVIVRIKADKPERYRYSLMIYTERNVFSYEYDATAFNAIPARSNIQFQRQEENPYGVIPIVEYPLNSTRQGIIEKAHMIDEAINLILSNNLDDIQQRVNAILVFINQALAEDDVKRLKDMGAICLVDPDSQRRADAKYVVNPLDHRDIRNTLDFLQDLMYALRGIPRFAASVNINNNSGQSSENNSGRTQANTFVKNHQIEFIRADKELLDVVIAICKATPDCPVDTITSSDIDIVFNINRSDNLLVKVQSLAQMAGIKLPKEVALNIAGLVSDSREVAKLWEKEVEAAPPERPPDEVIEVEETTQSG